jgi:predicted  nucleic acid-binding Zn-ribbon protein
MVEKLLFRIAELKRENDSLNQQLVEIAQRREGIVTQALTNNGRILELESLLAEESGKEH